DDLKLPASGTFVTKRYERKGLANRRPAGVSVRGVELRRPTATAPGEARARLRLAGGARFPARRHSLALLLADADTGAPVSLDYRKALSTSVDRRGNLSAVRLRIPAGAILPERLRAYVVADVYPMLVKQL
ncbi:MAG TPA: hypothetical protein VFQ12_07915, partial [Thermoleophilaceae bacterium]|nr:hypothetical protein [Thermoleophilaceae bacterium]